MKNTIQPRNPVPLCAKYLFVLLVFGLTSSCHVFPGAGKSLDFTDSNFGQPAKPGSGMVVGTQIEDAIKAGYETLKSGGNAMDAALVTSLAQVPLNLGNFITYAGIMVMLYYDSNTGQVYSMNAAWDIPGAEIDPASIPGYSKNLISSAQPSGRTALVPGFMAGVSAAHERFGQIPFDKLFEPAIAFAREGVIVDEMQAKLFRDFEQVIRRFPETRAIYTKENGELYQAGELFQQPELAATLESVASQGAEYMYTGSWGKKFVETLRREGGLITLDDMANYEVIWSQPASTKYHGYEVYAPGRPGFGGVSAIEAFNLFDLADLRSMGHYSQDADALFWLMQITRLNILDYLSADQIHGMFPGQDLSTEARMNKETSDWLWEQIQTGNFPFTNRPGDNSHSAAVISVDRNGNVAALVHTSNAYFYGGTGISVDGVYVPDPAALQQQSIKKAGPGERLPDPINPMIVLEDGVPVFVSSCTGQIHRESLQRMVSMLDFGYGPERAQSAPTIIAPDFSLGGTVERVAEDEFSRVLLDDVRRMGQQIEELEMTFENIIATRGLWIGVKIDPVNGSLLGSAPEILDGYVAGD